MLIEAICLSETQHYAMDEWSAYPIVSIKQQTYIPGGDDNEELAVSHSRSRPVCVRTAR
jgi:hypothetical protein